MRGGLPYLIILQCAGVLWLGGCAARKFVPAPISLPQSATSLEARNLDDPAMRAWMEQNAGFKTPDWPVAVWKPDAVTFAAYYFSPDLDVARANVAASTAAIRTAAAKPNPSLSVGPGLSTSPVSPYIFHFNFSVPIETAGKRGYRIAAATHLSDAALLRLGETAWTVRSRVRAALVDYLFSMRNVELLRNEEKIRTENVNLIEKGFRAGEISSPNLNQARTDLATFRLTLRAAEGQVGANLATLAAAIGVPAAALEGKSFRWAGIERPSPEKVLAIDSIRKAAVLNRLDVRRSLIEYEAAQSNLQLEIAKQYPDVDIGPGYDLDEGLNLFTIAATLILPIRNRNEGPIAEADAKRKVAGATLLNVQAQVIAQSDKALAQYRAVHATLDDADRAFNLQAEQERLAGKAFAAGEVDRLSLIGAQLQTAVGARARLDTLRQAQVALGAVEDAIQRPLDASSAAGLPHGAPR